jgi:uncharacterized protein YkwD
MQSKLYFYILIQYCALLIAPISGLAQPSNSVNGPPISTLYLAQTPPAVPALQYLNALRSRTGLWRFAPNSTLDKAAQNHAIYLASNQIASHYQELGKKNFTGVKPTDRAHYVGYDTGVIENLATGVETPETSIDGLMSAIYHRFGLLTFQHDEIGIGWITAGQNGAFNSFVTNSGNKAQNTLCQQPEQLPTGVSFRYLQPCRNAQLRIESAKFKANAEWLTQKAPQGIIWPPHNATQVPPVFFDEDPDPLPNQNVSGYPVSVQFNPKDAAPQNLSLELFVLGGKRVEPTLLMHKANDPHQRFSEREFALFPIERLQWGTNYEAVLKYTQNGKPFDIRWKFRTAEMLFPYMTLTESPKAAIQVKAGVDYAFYFAPRGQNDRFNQYAYEYRYKNKSFQPFFQIMDYNTLRVRLAGAQSGDTVLIRFGNGIHLPLVVL